jgi:hypothetical protein
MNRESPLVAASDTTVEFSSQCFWDLSGMCFFPFSNCASSVCVQTNAPHARWGSTPIPFNITGGTGDELSNDYRYADILQIINRRKSALQLKNPSERNSLKDHSLFLILFFTFAF